MTRVSVLPFLFGIGGALLLFVAWLPLAVAESRRPYRWRAAPPPRPERREPRPTPRIVVAPPTPAASPRVVAPLPRPRHAAAPRIAVVIAAFTVWSLWSLRGHHHHR